MFIYRILILLLFISFSLSAKSFNFRNLEIYGLKSISEEAVFNKILQSPSSKRYFSCTSRFVFERLAELNLFRKIELFWNKGTLKIFVVEKPTINSLKISFNKDKEILASYLDQLDIQCGGFYDTLKLSHLRTMFEEGCVSDGLNKSSLIISVDLNRDLNCVDITFSFLKGKFQKMKNVYLVGVKAFSRSKILSCLSYNKTSWMSFFWKNSIFSPDSLEVDVENIRSLYVDNGYSDFQIEFIRFFLSKKNITDVIIGIHEGEKFKIWDIELLGDRSIFTKEIDYYKFIQIIRSDLSENDIFSRQKLIDIRNKLKEFLLNLGFFNSEVNFSAYYAGETRLKVDFNFTKTPKVVVRHINFVGNYFTCDDTLRKMFNFLEGSTLSYADLELSKEEVIRSGISENINFDYVKNPVDSKEVDILFIIEEQKFSKMTAGFSYGEEDGLTLNVVSDFSNFLGLGHDLSLELNINGMESEFKFTYYMPYFFNDKVGVGYNIYYGYDNLDKNLYMGQSFAETFGAYLYYSFEIGKYDRLSFGLGCDMTFLGLCEEFLSEEVKAYLDRYGLNYKEYYFNIVWMYNSLNKVLNPTSGAFHSLNFKFNIFYLESKYYTITYDFNYYNNFYKEYVLNISSNIYFGNTYTPYATYPFFKNFHMKGPVSVRGYKDKPVSPFEPHEENLGGNFLFCTKFSLYFPAPLFNGDDFKTAIFFDIGQVYNTFKCDKKRVTKKFYDYVHALRYSIGLSFAWATPFGIPVEMALSYPFNIDEDTEMKNIFSITLGV